MAHSALVHSPFLFRRRPLGCLIPHDGNLIAATWTTPANQISRAAGQRMTGTGTRLLLTHPSLTPLLPLILSAVLEMLVDMCQQHPARQATRPHLEFKTARPTGHVARVLTPSALSAHAPLTNFTTLAVALFGTIVTFGRHCGLFLLRDLCFCACEVVVTLVSEAERLAVSTRHSHHVAPADSPACNTIFTKTYGSHHLPSVKPSDTVAVQTHSPALPLSAPSTAGPCKPAPNVA